MGESARGGDGDPIHYVDAYNFPVLPLRWSGSNVLPIDRLFFFREFLLYHSKFPATICRQYVNYSCSA